MSVVTFFVGLSSGAGFVASLVLAIVVMLIGGYAASLIS